MEFIERYQRGDEICNDSFEQTPPAKNVLRVMCAFYDVFKDDPMVADGSGMKELKVEYFRFLRFAQIYFSILALGDFQVFIFSKSGA